MRALIDADNLAIACAFTAENESVDIACTRANIMVESILNDTQCDEYELWLTGKGNFRYSIYPEYKAPRQNKKRPKWEHEVKAYLIEHWNANVSDGCEADDMLGVRLTEEGNKAILCHLDKDMDMIPGWHFNWELRRLGKVVRPATTYFVSEQEALRFFCYQLIMGDNTDNIKGIVGLGKAKADNILDSYEPSEWLKVIADMYGSEEELDMNAACLYIWRKKNDTWKNLMNGQKDENTPSS